jgi:hypothetical protein
MIEIDLSGQAKGFLAKHTSEGFLSFVLSGKPFVSFISPFIVPEIGVGGFAQHYKDRTRAGLVAV